MQAIEKIKIKFTYFTLKFFFISSLLLCIQSVTLVYAQANIELLVQEDQVNREPWDNYQTLISIQTPNYISSQFNAYAGIIAQRQGLYMQSEKLLTKAIDQATKADLPRVYIISSKKYR